MIDHKIGVTKLLGMNAPPVLVQWVVDFLTNEKQRWNTKMLCMTGFSYKRKTENEIQKCCVWLDWSGGVPKGNDALSNRDHQVRKYVDDLTIRENRVRGTICSLQPSMDSLSSWSQENWLKLNPTKCQAMRVYFGNKEIHDDDLFITNQQLAVVDKVRLLGVKSGMTWNGMVKLKTCVPRPTRNSSCCVNWKRLALAPRNLS